MASGKRTDEGENEKLRFAVYAHALALADLLLPVSRASQGLLTDWLLRHGHSPDLLPAMQSIHLPEEVVGVRRAAPHQASRGAAGAKAFLAVGTVCAHKNQLAAMAAFLRLIKRRPDLDIRLNVVGSVSAASAVAASVMAKRSNGRIVLHGFLPDDEIEAMAKGAHASVFVSLAEGFGVPVAESLWRGKPCLCSNEGSIAEIAAGGGCLTVNPRSLSDIEAGFETLAANGRRYQALLQEIASRRMRTWKDYADAVVRQLCAHSARAGASARRAKSLRELALLSVSRNRERPPSTDGGMFPAAVAPQMFVSASDLDVHPAYVSGREHPVRRNGAICFERATDGDVNERVLFFGPYVWLPAGAYAFAFDGEMDGALDIAFTGDEGRRRIADVSVLSFAEPVAIHLREPVDKFEIVGQRTPSLERLIFRGAFVEYCPGDVGLPGNAMVFPARAAAVASDEAAEGGAGPASTPAGRLPEQVPIYGRDDDGRPVRFPCAIPADGMRVHEAYGAGTHNVLRSDSKIVFRAKDHGRVAEKNLFFGPYLRLEPGEYAIRIDGDLQGRLRLRLTQKFASENLLDTILTGFGEPIRLKLASPAEKFEIIGDRVSDTRSVTLRAIEIRREPAPQHDDPRPPGLFRRLLGRNLDRGASARRSEADAPPSPLRDSAGRELPLPLTLAASSLKAPDAFGAGEGSRVRSGESIVFDAEAMSDVAEPILFSAPSLHCERGTYLVRLRGAVDGPLGIRFASNRGR